MDQMGQTDGVGLIIYSGSRDEMQTKLRARDDRITELEAALSDVLKATSDSAVLRPSERDAWTNAEKILNAR